MSRRLDIALYHDLGPGGAKRALVEMAALLKRRGHRLTLYCHVSESAPPSLDGLVDKIIVEPVEFRREGPVGSFLKSDVPDRITRRLRGSGVLFLARSMVDYRALTRELDALDSACELLARKIDSNRHDVVFAHGSSRTQSPSILPFIKTPTLYYAQEPLRMFYERPKKPVADPYVEAWRKATGVDGWTARYADKGRELKAARDRRNLFKATEVAVNSDFSRGAFKEFYGLDAKTCVLAVDAARFKKMAGVAKQNAVIAVGDLSPHKMHDFAVDAVAAVKQSVRPELWIVGRERTPGAKRALMDRAGRSNVKLTIFDDPPDNLLVEKYNAAIATLCAAFREPFGLTALESMSCGTPVVAAREGGYLETVADGETGIVCGRSPVEFASAIEKLLGDADLRDRMSATCVRRAAEWNWGKTVDQVEELLAETIKKQG